MAETMPSRDSEKSGNSAEQNISSPETSSTERVRELNLAQFERDLTPEEVREREKIQEQNENQPLSPEEQAEFDELRGMHPNDLSPKQERRLAELQIRAYNQ